MSSKTTGTKLAISKSGLYIVILFLSLSFIGRFLFPFGDEPDFTVAGPNLLDISKEWWTPYYWIHPFLKKITVSTNCIINSTPFSLWVSIPYDLCSENINQILIRFFINTWIVLPILLILLFRASSLTLIHILRFKVKSTVWSKRLDILGVSMLIPGMIYYLGVLSIEQYTLMLSLCIFLFWGSFFLILIFVTYISLIDLGNAIIIISFILIYLYSVILRKFFGSRLTVFGLLFLPFISYFLSYEVLEYTQFFPLVADKGEAMLIKASDGDFREKYPLLLRPFITAISIIFMTPSGIKSVLSLLLICITILYIYFKVFRIFIKTTEKNLVLNDKSFESDFITSVCGICTILCFVFLFPDYSNAKYYIFLFPFVLAPLFKVYQTNFFIKLFLINFILFYINIILYWIL